MVVHRPPLQRARVLTLCDALISLVDGLGPFRRDSFRFQVRDRQEDEFTRSTRIKSEKFTKLYYLTNRSPK
jgi:hypothetical protein